MPASALPWRMITPLPWTAPRHSAHPNTLLRAPLLGVFAGLARAALGLALLASASASGGPATEACGGPATTEARATVSDDGRSVVVHAADGSWSYSIDEWRAWAQESLSAQVATPLAIGPRQVGADDFERFGAAVVDPVTGDLFVSVTTYAMLTTLSLVGVLEPATATDPAVMLMPEPRMGDVEEPVWAPHARTVAYALGTARGRGQSLHLDDLGGRRGILTLTRQDLHRAWLAHELPLTYGHLPEDPDAYQPAFRDLAWDAAGARLSFTVDAPGSGWDDADPDAADAEAWRWSVRADGSSLRPEGAVASR